MQPDAPAPTAIAISAASPITGWTAPGAVAMPPSAVTTTRNITRGLSRAKKSRASAVEVSATPSEIASQSHLKAEERTIKQCQNVASRMVQKNALMHSQAAYWVSIVVVRSPRFEVLRCLHFVDVTRIYHTMPGMVYFLILRPFGPSRATAMRHA